MRDPIIILTVLTAFIQLLTAVHRGEAAVWIDTVLVFLLCINVIFGRMQINRMTERSDA